MGAPIKYSEWSGRETEKVKRYDRPIESGDLSAANGDRAGDKRHSRLGR
jgi:hypothetical protein